MFTHEVMIEVERRLQAALDERARAGLPPPVDLAALRACVRADLRKELDARQVVPAKPVPKPVPAVMNAAPRAPIPAKPVRAVATAAPRIPAPPKPLTLPSPVVVAERTRALALIAVAPAGSDAMLRDAIMSGMSLAAFEKKLAVERLAGQVREIVKGRAGVTKT